MVRFLKRDPAFWAGAVAVGVQFLVAWGLELTEEQQAGINAAVTLAFGLIVAWAVARDQVVAIAASLLVALLQLGVSFGWDISQDKIASAGALLVTILAAYLRTQVTAPVAADGSTVPRQTVSKAA